MDDLVKYMGSPAGALTVGVVAGASALYMASRPKPIDTILDLQNQSQEVPGIPACRMSALCKDGKLKEVRYKDVTTLYEGFLRGSRVSGNGPCLGYREDGSGPYKWISYNDVLSKAEKIGASLIAKGLAPENCTRVGIYSQNRAEYALLELGCYMYSMVNVPLYDTLGPDTCTYVINQAEISLVACDKNEKVATLLSNMEETPHLKTIVVMETASQSNIQLAAELKIDLVQFSDLEGLGKTNPHKMNPATPDDIAVISYTSGTTGVPKGTMISHRGLIAAKTGLSYHLDPLKLGPDDSYISYLPMAHVYERIAQAIIFCEGGQVGFFSGDILKLMDDIQTLRPTIFPAVPRLLNRIYDKTMAAIAGSSLKTRLFNMGIQSKMAELQRGIIRRNSIWDKLVFGKIQQSLGGRVRFISCGSAPLSSRVLNFVRCAFGCTLIEGYGQTESSAVCAATVEGEFTSGHVGPPVPCNMIKLVDVPEMNYMAANNQGEICTKGPNVCLGYLKMPDKTAEAIDKDGWLHTGDIGEWLPNGTLKIIDRQKHIFKLAQGEYIAPEKIENICLRSSPVMQMFVTGNSLESCLVGIVVPDQETFQEWAAKAVGVIGDISTLCSNQEVNKAVLADITKIGKKSGLKSFEQVKKIHLHAEPFTIENGFLTPSFKSKRPVLQNHFKNHVAEMYALLS